MKQKTFIVQYEHGIHARPAVKIVETCQQLDSQITICSGCKKADGCSILQVLLLAAGKGASIEVIAEGGNEEHAIHTLTQLFEHGAGI